MQKSFPNRTDKTACIIMASGLGKRFGGNKLMAEVNGQPMIRYILNATEGLFSRRIVVTRHEAVCAYCEENGIEAILHKLPHRSDTIRLGIEALDADTEKCIFCPGDQPLVTRESIIALLEAARKEPEFIFQLAWLDTRGMPVCFPSWAFAELTQLPQGKGGSILMKKYPERIRCVSARDAYELMDVDTPEDLECIRRLMKQ